MEMLKPVNHSIFNQKRTRFKKKRTRFDERNFTPLTAKLPGAKNKSQHKQHNFCFRFLIFMAIFELLSIVDASTVIELNEEYGIIESPHYPQIYQDDEDITWRITAPEGYQIMIYFATFDLEDSYDEDFGGVCAYDYVEV